MTALRRFIAEYTHPGIRAWRKRTAQLRALRGKPGAHTRKLLAEQQRFVLTALRRGS
jgi:hypothetical protein